MVLISFYLFPDYSSKEFSQEARKLFPENRIGRVREATFQSLKKHLLPVESEFLALEAVQPPEAAIMPNVPVVPFEREDEEPEAAVARAFNRVLTDRPSVLARALVNDLAKCWPQVWSLIQFNSVDFSQSRIDVKKCVFYKRTIKACVQLFLTVSLNLCCSGSNARGEGP